MVEMSKSTIIISALNEQYLVPTIETILDRTPAGLLQEIIVVDDCSTVPINYTHPKVQVVRNKTRQGLIRSRQTASLMASGDNIISVDAHVKVAKDWLQPIHDKLDADYKRIVIPGTVGLNAETWVETPRRDFKTAWAWDLNFHWCHDDGSDYTPAIAGHCYACTKQWFEETGGYDEGMLQWGGENIEFPLRTWLAGGSVEVARDSTVAHQFKSSFANYRVDGNQVIQNKSRIANVWMDEYLHKFHQASGRKPNPGNVASRLALKRRIQKRPFSWFLDRFGDDLRGVLSYQGMYRGKAVAILGSGPSLDNVTQDMLNHYDVIIGVNYNSLAFKCDYVFFHDVKPAEIIKESGNYSASQLFVPRRLKHGTNRVSTDHLGWVLYDLATQDDERALRHKGPPFFHHASTVHTAIHFAVFSGFTTIALFGCDAKLAANRKSHTSLVPQYRNGFYWPDNADTLRHLARCRKGFAALKQTCKQWGISLIGFPEDT